MPAQTDAAAREAAAEGLHWIKADFHLHTAEDPYDHVDYDAYALLDDAHALGFGALAITLHGTVFNDEAVHARARELGILLIPAAELRVERADVVLLNLSAAEAARVRTFDDLRALRERRGDDLFVFAPHPFYVLGGSIGPRLEQHLDCFDGIEFCHLHVPFFNPNRRAARLAEASGKPLLATSDAHRRRFFGRNYSLVGVPRTEGIPSVEAVFAAMRAHRVRRPRLSGEWSRFVVMMAFLFVVSPIVRRMSASKRSRQPERRAGGGRGTEPRTFPVGTRSSTSSAP